MSFFWLPLGEDAKPRRVGPRQSLFISLALVSLSGALHAFGWAGFGFYPLGFIAFVPLLFALERELDASKKRRFSLGFVHGFAAYGLGYHWLVPFLETFSGYGFGLSLLFASIFYAYLALLTALLALAYRPLRRGGLGPTLTLIVGLVALEEFFPTLFPSHFSVTLHNLPIALQIVDLGGPGLLTAVILLVNGAVYELTRAAIAKERPPLRVPAIAAAAVLFTLVYGAYRIDEVEAKAADAPKVKVGLVQTNMGIFDKREDPREGHYRHIEQSLQLEREEGPLDLLVWPESAYHYTIPETVENVGIRVRGPISSPLLFGGIATRGEGDEFRYFNTAYLTDEDGEILGTYDKTFLLMFGEYLPFGERFPFLYELSPNSGRFTKGEHKRPLILDEMRISTLICYEDVLPRFTRDAVREARPNILVNITNDAWFGDTQEPGIHLAMAKLRAVEHHRALVRATNSGISAIISPTGATIAESGLLTRENLVAELPLMERKTLYELLGPFPAYLSLLLGAFAAFRAKRLAKKSLAKPSPAKPSGSSEPNNPRG